MSSPNHASYSTDATPALTGSAAEAGATILVYNSDNTCAAAPVGSATVAGDGTFSISAFSVAASGDGTKSFYYKITDTLGNASECLNTGKSYTYDVTAPTASSISIESDATETNSTTVSVSMSGSDATSGLSQFCLSETTDCSTCVYESITGNPTSTKNLTFAGTPVSVGVKNASVRFKDAAGNTSSCISDSIIYEQVTVANSKSSVANKSFMFFGRTSDPTHACSGDEDATALGCTHYGALRSVVVPTSIATSCADGATVTDSLGVFNWLCRYDTDRSKLVFDAKFKPNKGLKDLINSSENDFNAMSVTLSKGGSTYSSYSQKWWDDDVRDPPGETIAGTTFSTSGLYYYSASTTTAGFKIATNGVGIVIGPGATITSNISSNNCNDNADDGITAKCLLRSKGFKMLYIEGDFDSASDSDFGMIFYDNQFITLRNVHIKNTLANTIYFSGSKGNYIFDTIITNNLSAARPALYFYNSSYNYIDSIRAFNNYNSGFRLDASSHNTISNSIFASNDGNGFDTYWESQYNNLVNITSINNLGSGIYLYGPSATYNNIHSLISYNNGVQDLYIREASSGTNSQIALSDAGPKLEDSVNVKFTGNLGIKATAGCSSTGFVTPYGLADTTCDNEGESDKTFFQNFDLSSSFIGKVTSDDTLNSSDTNGTELYNDDMDFFNFDKIFRFWGVDGSAFMSNDNRGKCSSGTCRIWDVSLSRFDTNILNRSYDFTNLNHEFTDFDNCTYNGDDYLELVSAIGTKYMHLASEIIGDAIGDEDGLCEDNESCMYTPNVGAYQGHGTIGTCTFNDGTLGGIMMHGWNSNGY